MDQLQKCYLYIKDIMYAAFKVDTFLSEYPYQNIKDMDNGLRSILLKDYDIEENRKYLMDIVSKVGNRLSYAKSELGFSSVVYITSEKFGYGMISVGPFLNQEIDNTFISEILTKNEYECGFRKTLLYYYESLPVVNENAIMSALAILLTRELDLEEPIEQIRQISEKIAFGRMQYKSELVYQFSEELSVTYRETHNILLEAVSRGNVDVANKTLPYLFPKNGKKSSLSLGQLKLFVHSLNVKCETALLIANIHPYYVKKLFAQLEDQIERENRYSNLETFCYQILRKYCFLVKNYSLSNNSKTVRDAINYIQLHVCEPLSLTVLAEKLGKSKQFLSSVFKKETGKTITDYIQEQKMQYATMLLNLSDIPIQDVAMQVGINDTSYFTKVYKKFTGLTPGEYRKRLYI